MRCRPSRSWEARLVAWPTPNVCWPNSRRGVKGGASDGSYENGLRRIVHGARSQCTAHITDGEGLIGRLVSGGQNAGHPPAYLGTQGGFASMVYHRTRLVAPLAHSEVA